MFSGTDTFQISNLHHETNVWKLRSLLIGFLLNFLFFRVPPPPQTLRVVFLSLRQGIPNPKSFPFPFCSGIEEAVRETPGNKSFWGIWM